MSFVDDLERVCRTGDNKALQAFSKRIEYDGKRSIRSNNERGLEESTDYFSGDPVWQPYIT